jgi:hypothetical protein
MEMTKVQAFADLLQQEQIERLVSRNLACDGNVNSAKTCIVDGNKYIKVDIGTGGRYMIEKETGIIFGIKAYGQVHKGHAYGTVDTIAEWDWSDYYPKRRTEPKKTVAVDLPVPVEKKKEEIVPVVGMGVTMIMYSDRVPFEVIEVINDRRINVREMKATINPNFKPNFIPGGFCGTVVNQDEQEWILTSNPQGEVKELFKTKRCKGFGKWLEKGTNGSGYYFSLGKAYNFYDYNY